MADKPPWAAGNLSLDKLADTQFPKQLQVPLASDTLFGKKEAPETISKKCSWKSLGEKEILLSKMKQIIRS